MRAAGWTSDFMDLRAGSLLRADGGFLIMYSIEALSEPGVWRALKRTLNHNRLEIQPFETFYPFTTTALKPEPIEINVKVILIGDRNLYELLYEYEEDFRKIFKVRVEFDEEMAMSDGVIEEYAGRIRTLSEKENLFPFDRGAFAAILEHGVRKAGREIKLRHALWILPIWRAKRTTPRRPPEKMWCGRHMCARRLRRKSSGTI